MDDEIRSGPRDPVRNAGWAIGSLQLPGTGRAAARLVTAKSEKTST
jgi:hypothetical protein